jgi:hypothetical protein
MRLHFIVIGALVLSSVGCGSQGGAQGLNTNEGQTAANRRQEGDKTDANKTPDVEKKTDAGKAPDAGKQIDAKKALAIARKDALEDFETLDGYKITVSEDERGWHVVFGPKDPRAHGGGPEYLIDKRTGEILHKVITQ